MSTVLGRGNTDGPYGSPRMQGREVDLMAQAEEGGAAGQIAESHKDKPSTLTHLFTQFSGRTATAVGSPWAFLLAFGVIAVWAITGPLFGFSDTWQLVINTGTTIVTFLMVFLIQHTQNRDARALHIKLDELIRAVEAARDDIIDVEDANDEELETLQHEFEKERERATHPDKSNSHGGAPAADSARPNQESTAA
jgi:low affinity Fe/Cu permease